MIGETLSHYEIVGKIGAGGMGEVYRARDPRLGREVAIKVLPSSLSQNTKRLARFEQEARAVGALNHPNVLAIYDVGNDRGIPFLVTELLEGETLRDRINSGSLTRRKAVEYAAQIADGLAAAHGRNIVHRDLKPDNIFITRDGHLKILDFGLAKLTERDPSNPVSTESPTEALTDANVVVGTPGYMSPEQLHGEPADARSDIFAFGVILYEMISGRRPFVGDSAAEISASIMRDDPTPLSGLDRPVPPTLDRMVRQCLEKSPDERFESAHDLAHMLRAVSDTGEVLTFPPTRPKKRPWIRVAAAAAAIAVAAVVGWELLDLQPAPGIPEVKHVAVLPFEAVGDDPESRFLAAGLAATVADGLTIMERETRGAAWVVPLSPGLTLEEARTTHNATIGVRGVFATGVERFRLDLELVDTASGRTLVHRTLDESVRNSTSLQTEPVRVVWEMLGFEATPAALEDLDESSTNTVIACRAFVSGRGRLSTAENETELQAAVASLEQAVEESPGYAPARVALARAFARLFKETRDERWKERAIAEAEYAIGLDDDAAEPYLVLGEVYGKAGQTELEIEAHRQAAAHAKTARPFYLLGKAATDAGEFKEAERALQTAINLRPDWFNGHSALGYLYVQTGRYDAAANEYRHAARAAPEYPEAHTNLGAVLYFQDRRDEARQAFEAALALGPNAAAYSNLGVLYFEEARYGDAVEMFESAVELGGEDIPPDQYNLVGNLASAQYWSGERESARASYEHAIDLAESYLGDDRDNQAAMADLAEYYGMVGQHDRGIELLEAVTRKEIHDPYFMGAIAESYEILGERGLAVRWIGTALDNGLTVDWFERTPAFNSLREDDRYRKLVQQSMNRG
jgi:serine/threonine-protein kinase